MSRHHRGSVGTAMSIDRFGRAVSPQKPKARAARKREALLAGKHVPGDWGRAISPTTVRKVALCTHDGCFEEQPCTNHNQITPT